MQQAKQIHAHDDFDTEGWYTGASIELPLGVEDVAYETPLKQPVPVSSENVRLETPLKQSLQTVNSGNQCFETPLKRTFPPPYSAYQHRRKSFPPAYTHHADTDARNNRPAHSTQNIYSRNQLIKDLVTRILITGTIAFCSFLIAFCFVCWIVSLVTIQEELTKQKQISADIRLAELESQEHMANITAYTDMYLSNQETNREFIKAKTDLDKKAMDLTDESEQIIESNGVFSSTKKTERSQRHLYRGNDMNNIQLPYKTAIGKIEGDDDEGDDAH